MALPTKTLGSWGEQRAAVYLENLGYTIIARNFRYGHGEIDLIVEDKGTLVFVEVKTQKSDAMGEAFTWVTRKKQRQIGRVALAYLTVNGITDRDCRFDVIAVAKGQNGIEIKHIVNAFWL